MNKTNKQVTAQKSKKRSEQLDRYSKSIANEQQMLKFISKLTRPEDKVSLLNSYCKLMCFNFNN